MVSTGIRRGWEVPEEQPVGQEVCLGDVGPPIHAVFFLSLENGALECGGG